MHEYLHIEVLIRVCFLFLALDIMNQLDPPNAQSTPSICNPQMASTRREARFEEEKVGQRFINFLPGTLAAKAHSSFGTAINLVV